MKRWGLLVVLVLSATILNAQSAPLLPGMGRHHHPITTKSAEAQKFFDQGLALLYGFNHEEAVRSFRRVAELDPDAAMAYWGIALGLGPNYNLPEVDREVVKAADEAVHKARALAGKMSERERAYIEALAHRYSSDQKANPKKLGAEYADAMAALVARYPDDLDAATIYAESLMNLRPWDLWSADGKPAPDTERIVAVLESVLRRDPEHPGANHYYIHAIEASPHPERALPSAERLAQLVPGGPPGSYAQPHLPAARRIRAGRLNERPRCSGGPQTDPAHR